MHPSQAEVSVYASNVLTDGPPSIASLSMFLALSYACLANVTLSILQPHTCHNYQCRYIEQFIFRHV